MTTAERLFTPREAAAVSGVAVKAVNNAIDKHVVVVVRTRVSKMRKTPVRKLSEDSLVRLKLWHAIGGFLTRERRERLFAEIEAKPTARHVKADHLLIVDVGEARDEIAANVRELDDAKAAIVQNKAVLGGEPVFVGTRIPVRAIAAMLDAGASEDEILEGYPALERHLLSMAKIWVAAHPPRGRPKSLKDRGFALKSTTKGSLAVAADKPVAST
jgi:uncharacterized protein (DUF433 family)